MRISDWSSDVCSSDLNFAIHLLGDQPLIGDLIAATEQDQARCLRQFAHHTLGQALALRAEVEHRRGLGSFTHRRNTSAQWLDRQRVVQGKSVSVSVGIGGCRILKKKKKTQQKN